MLRAGTDKTRANESRSSGEGKQRRDKKEEGAMHCAENLAQPKKQGSSRQSRTKKDGGGGEREREREELSSWYCCTVQYLQVPWLPQGFSSQPVGCSHVSPRHPDTHVHSYAPSSSPATRMQRSISTCQPHTHTKQTKLRLRQQHSPHHCRCR